MKESRGEKIFYIFNNIFLIILTCLILYPIVYVISASFSSGTAIKAGQVKLLPVDFDLSAYKYTFTDNTIWIAYLNSFFYTIFGTAIAMVFTILGAYTLSKDDLPGKRVISFFFTLTMWFGAGMIPTFLNYRDLGLIDSRWGILLHGACSAYNMILLKNFFSSIPKSLEEACDIDGATQMQILTKVYLPLSKASLACITLFYAVARWNEYMWPMIIVSSDSKIPLQVVVKKIIVDLKETVDTMNDELTYGDLSNEGLIYATIVVSSVPMLVLYPFIQKYFVGGVMIGAVKG